jgi:hypothetical protein
MLRLNIFSLAAAIKSQFIEIPREPIHVGDDIVLKCSLADVDQKSRSDANFVWYLNGESREMKELLLIFPFASFISFFSLSCCFSATSLHARLMLNR